MNYLEQIERLYRTDVNFRNIVELLKNLRKGCRVLVFSHNDVDGVCSAFLVERTLRRFLNANVVIIIPQMFKLSELEVREAVNKNGMFDLLVVCDKGTFEDYDYFSEIIENVIIIDHHPRIRLEKCYTFNPMTEESEYASASSLLCHMLMVKTGFKGGIEDFVATIGCRGDFAFDAVSGKCQNFAKPFFEMVKHEFPELFLIKEGSPTMFDIEDRTRTAVLHQISEIVHAGTLGHLYVDDIGDKIIYGPELILRLFSELSRPPKSVEEFLSTPSGVILQKVYMKFKQDWEILEKRVKEPIFLGKVHKASVYLIFAREVSRAERAPYSAILPFVAHAHMMELKKEGEEVVLIVFSPKEIGTHLSMRTDGGTINCGKLLSKLAEELKRKYPAAKIGGGGHAQAAGFLASTDVPTYEVLHHLVFLLEEILTETVT